MKIQLFAACILLIVPALLSAGPIADLYRQMHKEEPNQPRGDIPKAKTPHNITEVGLERTECYGKCPVYSVTIKADGSFRYLGKANVEHIGEFSGNVPTYALNQLLNFIAESGFQDLKDSYSSPITDMPTVYTLVITNGQTKIVSNYAHMAPSKVWAIEQLIDKLIADADWSKATEVK